jgi:hypothetical protein
MTGLALDRLRLDAKPGHSRRDLAFPGERSSVADDNGGFGLFPILDCAKVDLVRLNDKL